MAKGGCEYAANAMGMPETGEEGAVREAVAAAFEGSGGTYGHRRPLPEANDIPGLDAGERTVRKIMGGRGRSPARRGGSAGTAAFRQAKIDTSRCRLPAAGLEHADGPRHLPWVPFPSISAFSIL